MKNVASREESWSWADFRREINKPVVRATEAEINDFDDFTDTAALVGDPILSIIVRTYRQEDSLGECLESILRQKTTYQYEIIVSEDGSPDGTLAVAKEYQRRYPDRIRLLGARKNHRAANGRARIERFLRGRYVSWCEGDDHWVDDERIERQVSYLESHAECNFLASRYCVVDAQHRFLYEAPDLSLTQKDITLQHTGYVFAHLSTWCVRRSFYDRICDLARKTGVGTDTTLLQIVEGIDHAYIMPEVVSEYHLTGDGVWTSLKNPYRRFASCIRCRLLRARHLPEPMSSLNWWDACYQYYGVIREAVRQRRLGFAVRALFACVTTAVCHPRTWIYGFRRIRGKFDKIGATKL